MSDFVLKDFTYFVNALGRSEKGRYSRGPGRRALGGIAAEDDVVEFISCASVFLLSLRYSQLRCLISTVSEENYLPDDYIKFVL